MDNLIIGNTSQLSYFFPEEFTKISSRNLDFDFLKSRNWGDVYLCFGESRKFISDNSNYDKVNYSLTKKIIETLNEKSSKIVIYSTCELWNKYNGPIKITDPINFYSTPYLESKYKISDYVTNNKNLKNTIILYPFNFNSIHRKGDFLFGKIFDSILQQKKITISDTYFYRDIIHPKFVVEKSICSEKNEIIGSGRLTFVNDFIQDLYKEFGLNYKNFVTEKFGDFIEYDKRNEYYLKSDNCLYSYSDLLNNTKKDLETYGRSNKFRNTLG
jgi:hypothetical protein